MYSDFFLFNYILDFQCKTVLMYDCFMSGDDLIAYMYFISGEDLVACIV